MSDPIHPAFLSQFAALRDPRQTAKVVGQQRVSALISTALR